MANRRAGASGLPLSRSRSSCEYSACSTAQPAIPIHSWCSSDSTPCGKTVQRSASMGPLRASAPRSTSWTAIFHYLSAGILVATRRFFFGARTEAARTLLTGAHNICARIRRPRRYFLSDRRATSSVSAKYHQTVIKAWIWIAGAGKRSGRRNFRAARDYLVDEPVLDCLRG